MDIPIRNARTSADPEVMPGATSGTEHPVRRGGEPSPRRLAAEHIGGSFAPSSSMLVTMREDTLTLAQAGNLLDGLC